MFMDVMGVVDLIQKQRSYEVVKTEMPVGVTQEDMETYLGVLDVLRESGATNMFGATPYLIANYSKLRKDNRLASAVLMYWMGTFEERHPRG